MRRRVGGMRPARSGVTPPRGAAERSGCAGRGGAIRPARGEQWALAMWQASMPKGAKQEERRASCLRLCM
jgi:hypothetical protein